MKRRQLHRIYADFNDGNMERGYSLHLPDSRRDLALMGDKLAVGTRVIICMPNELEMEAILEFDWTCDLWIAKPVLGTTKYLDTE